MLSWSSGEQSRAKVKKVGSNLKLQLHIEVKIMTGYIVPDIFIPKCVN